MSRNQAMFRRFRRGFRSLGVLSALVALGACGGNLEIPAVEKSIADGLEQQLGLAMSSVTCPRDRRAWKAGDTFRCTGRPALGGSLLIEVTQKDDRGEIGWKVTKSSGLFDLQEAGAAVEQGFRDQMGAEVQLSCGDRWQVGTTGDTFECAAAATDGTTRTVVITVQNEAGNISWKLK